MRYGVEVCFQSGLKLELSMSEAQIRELMDAFRGARADGKSMTYEGVTEINHHVVFAFADVSAISMKPRR